MRRTPARRPDPRLSNLVLEGGRSKVYASYRCERCQRTMYHPDDVANRYCPCCGSADGLLPKDCEHTRSA